MWGPVIPIPNIRMIKLRRMRCVCTAHGEDGKCVYLIGKLEGRGTFTRPRRRWEVDIKMELWGIGRECVSKANQSSSCSAVGNAWKYSSISPYVCFVALS
jgi:hypothetical protein